MSRWRSNVSRRGLNDVDQRILGRRRVHRTDVSDHRCRLPGLSAKRRKLARRCGERSLQLYRDADSIRSKGTKRGIHTWRGARDHVGRNVWQSNYDPVSMPSKLVVGTAPTKWQYDVELEPMGYDVAEDEFVLIDDLPYKPDGGWEKQYPGEFEDVPNDEDVPDDENEQKNAKKYIWKRYRIRFPGAEDGAEDPPLKDALVDIEELDQVLPMTDSQVETEVKKGKSIAKDCIVYGKYHDGESLGITTIDEFDGPADYKKELEYEGSFTLDTEHGYVDFAQPIYDMTEDPDPTDEDEIGARIVKPMLRLRVALNLFHKDTGAVQRYGKEFVVDETLPTKPEYVTLEDLTLEYHQDEEQEWQDNESEVLAAINFFSVQKLQEYKRLPAATASYAGFIMQELDGAIRQATRTIGGDGKATETLNRNQENPRKAVTLKEHKRLTDISDALKERKIEQRKQAKDERAAKRGRRTR